MGVGLTDPKFVAKITFCTTATLGVLEMKDKASEVKALLMSNKGKVFSVVFTKKDGSKRHIVAQQGYFKGHDGPNPTAHIPKYLTVKEFMTGDFKNIDCSSVQEIHMKGKVYIL